MNASRTRSVGRAALMATLTFLGMTPGRAAAAIPAIVLSEGGIQFPDGTLLESAAPSYGGVTVVAKSGGEFASIQAAIDSLPDPVEETHLLWIAPGVYEEQIRLKDNVYLRGAGPGLTKIVSSADPVVHVSQYPAYHSNNALSSLAIEGAVWGIEVGTGRVSLDQVSVHLDGPGGYGITVGGPWGGSGLTMIRSHVSVLGGEETAVGIFVYKAGLALVHSGVDVSGSGSEQPGIEVGEFAGATLHSSSVSSIVGGAVVRDGSYVGSLEVGGGKALVVYSEVGATVGEPSRFECLGAHRGVEPLDAQCQPVPPPSQ